MPQARLPDINAAFTKYRNETLTNLKGEKYTLCIGSLYAFNGLLPDEYQIKVSNNLYKSVADKDVKCFCKCGAEFKRQDLKVFDLLLTFVQKLLSGDKTKKAWVCTECNKINDLLKTRMVKEIYQEPHFFEVVPEPPKQKDGTINRHSFHQKFETWALMFLGELETKAAKFRDDNWQKTDGYMDADDLDGGEDKE